MNSNLKDIANLILFGKATNTTPMLLKTVSSGKIEPKKLITHHFKLDEILQAYLVMLKKNNGSNIDKRIKQKHEQREKNERCRT